MAQQFDPNRTRDRDQEAIIFLWFLLIAVVSVVIWLGYTRLHCTVFQLIEFSLYPLLAAGMVFEVLRFASSAKTKRAALWPRSTPFVSHAKDRANLAGAVKGHNILVGYESDGQPWLWSNNKRRMQAIAFGKSGAGKTTLLHTIAEQDIASGCPLIFIDGKGEFKLLSEVMPAIRLAGRIGQLRLLDPTHPEISSPYNPFWSPTGDLDEQVSSIFEALRRTANVNEFFDSHQRVYLEDIAKILSYSGKRVNIYDVLVTAYDKSVMRRQMKIAWERVNVDPNATRQQRLTLHMNIHHLLATFEDDDRVTKIQGLLNDLMTFQGDNFARITGSYEGLLTLNEVIENNLILYVSLNTNIRPRATAALGRVLLQNLQLIIGRRYSQLDATHPFVSVIMDEFAPFAYGNFADVIQQARGTNICFLFSLQNSPQLLEVGKAFRNDLSSAPNTTFMLRNSEQETAEQFLDASGRVTKLRRSVQVRKSGLLNPEFSEQETGSQSEVLETMALDEHLKMMPTGQLELLMSDDDRGLLYKHVHIRQPIRHYATLPLSLYPSLAVPQQESVGLNLRLPAPDLEEPAPPPQRGRRSHRGARQ
jgi:hypothetical protein